jgi:hypothetical protein
VTPVVVCAWLAGAPVQVPGELRWVDGSSSTTYTKWLNSSMGSKGCGYLHFLNATTQVSAKVTIGQQSHSSSCRFKWALHLVCFFLSWSFCHGGMYLQTC